MGQGGDLIVAIDDQRVRDQGDLQNAMARLKPGDTMYLTVIRPNGIDERAPHQTIKIAVKVGAIGEPIANAAPASGFTH
jgi:S1-C subfamily serine protease